MGKIKDIISVAVFHFGDGRYDVRLGRKNYQTGNVVMNHYYEVSESSRERLEQISTGRFVEIRMLREYLMIFFEV